MGTPTTYVLVTRAPIIHVAVGSTRVSHTVSAGAGTSTVARATWFSGMNASSDAVEVGQREDLRPVVDELTVDMLDQVRERRLRIDLGGLAEADREDVLVGHRGDLRPPGVHRPRQLGDRRPDVTGVRQRGPSGPVLAERPVVPL